MGDWVGGGGEREGGGVGVVGCFCGMRVLSVCFFFFLFACSRFACRRFSVGVESIWFRSLHHYRANLDIMRVSAYPVVSVVG